MNAKFNPKLLRGLIILNEKRQDQKIKETEERLKTLKKLVK